MYTKNNRTEFSSITKRNILDNEFKKICMFINCSSKLKRIGSSSFTGDFCHIIAASKGGPRYSDKYSVEFIGSTANCLLLCKTCAYKIDKSKIENNEPKYTADYLFTMKKNYLKKFEHYDLSISYSELFIELKELLDFINEKILGETEKNNEIKMPLDITTKLKLNELGNVYQKAVKDTTKLFNDINKLVNLYDDNMNKRINEIKKYYIDISNKNGNDVFGLIIKFIIQENDYFYMAAMHFASYLFIRCDILKTKDSEVAKLLC